MIRLGSCCLDSRVVLLFFGMMLLMTMISKNTMVMGRSKAWTTTTATRSYATAAFQTTTTLSRANHHRRFHHSIIASSSSSSSSLSFSHHWKVNQNHQYSNQDNILPSKSIILSSLSSSSRLFSTMSSSSSSSSSNNNNDSSAASKSRAPFRMPRNSPDDSTSRQGGESNNLSWNKLGLLTEIVTCLQSDEMSNLQIPTPVQSLVIPHMLDNPTESLAFLSATGSGKTLAYLLPLIQNLKQQELFENYERRPKRPRLLIMTPTRELCIQITSVLKVLGHSIKISSQSLVGGQDKGTQRKALQSRPVDVVVATPGRLLKHWKEESLYLGSLQTIVLDEMDTMLEQGFQRELCELLYPLLYKGGKPPPPKQQGGSSSSNTTPEELSMKENAPRIVMTSATMTQSIQKLIGDNPKTSDLALNAKKLHYNPGTATSSQEGGGPSGGLVLPKMKIISAPGLHKAIPRLEQIFVDVGNTDKISLLIDVVSSSQRQHKATIVFCNTASSVRAVQYALADAGIETFAYHGELNSQARSDNLRNFRQQQSNNNNEEEEDGHQPKFLICTDLAARGLDIPEVDHVIMFDFPLNAMDYLHRSGRTARGTGQGKVTALVAKRDQVLATAIENAVSKGQPLDGLSSRKSDYQPGAKFGIQSKKGNKKKYSVGGRGRGGGRGGGRGAGGGRSRRR